MLELDWETYIIGRGTGRRRKLEISSKGRKRTRASTVSVIPFLADHYPL